MVLDQNLWLEAMKMEQTKATGLIEVEVWAWAAALETAATQATG
jgi:hypothetical protein